MRYLSIIAGLLVASPVLALDLAPGAEVGKTEAEVRTSLTDMGFDVRKIEMEDGKIEAYVVKGKELAEVYVDPASGKISKVEQE